ncbi:(2Fe-2S)-binding protein [Bradyrhizobium guangzhouense]|uniref:(2Fe-2S)-binding protein n=1 Tax=Bradyrhizobium guangzhouense TaxID=1325095 RepID=A0AAE6C6K3_9BRAD|nr:(2Fe-2S)-binding protein [Bradyrhizobium guangzhouense]QAU44517.1 (2Fe-2S)-binding protein [Bradyrhizobium guangzhouense]RXH12685.1 (2Fe-2S)-binding protein [Bradyrhizobium guangzhouense]
MSSPIQANDPIPQQRIALSITINGMRHDLEIAPTASLLDVIRDELGLTGTKKGCDMGGCGACTVLVAGRHIASCLALAASFGGAVVTTIEGVGTADRLHPLQAAFIRHDALQCGYCTPGQILSGIALLSESPQSIDDIREGMSGNLCRCGAYPNIVAAIAEVAGL